MRIITRDLAEGHLRITVATSSPPSAEEIDFLAKIEQAEALVLDYVNQRRIDGDLWLDEIEVWNVGDPDFLPPPQIQAAVLVQLAELYRFRGDDLAAEQPIHLDGDVLHPRAKAYLYRHRDPAVS